MKTLFMKSGGMLVVEGVKRTVSQKDRRFALSSTCVSLVVSAHVSSHSSRPFPQSDLETGRSLTHTHTHGHKQ